MGVQIRVKRSHLIGPHLIIYSISIIMVRVVVEVGDLHPLAIIVVSLVTSAPYRMGGNMYLLPTQLPNRLNDYGREIKGEARSSGLTQEVKEMTKVLHVVCFEKANV